MAAEERTYITVKEFICLLGGRLSKNSIYAAIASNTIPSVRVGRRILLPADALDRLMTAQSEQADTTVDEFA